MVLSLSQLFQLGLNRGKEMTSIERELLHVEEYLKIQQRCYETLFTYSIEVDPLVDMQQPILKIMLQPLVENSILHGFNDRNEGGYIRIQVTQDDAHLYFIVEDNGLGISENNAADPELRHPAASAASGYALHNVRLRLQLQYGSPAGLHMESEPNVCTRVSIIIPVYQDPKGVDLRTMSVISTTICFIDDIQSVVDGISKQINWERHGITVSGTAINGEDGLNLITSSKPDIIVTDIRMPKLDGLELTRRVKELLPRSKVILMTGFSDFEYAKQAVQLGAFNFITKPFSLAHIEEIVVKAKEEIEALRNQEHHIADLEQRVQESMPFLRQELFAWLLHHKVNEQEAKQRWEYVTPDLEPRQLLVMILEIDGFDDKYRDSPMNELELARFALKNITEETIAVYTRGLVFRDTANRLVAVLNAPLSNSVSAIAEACCHHVSVYTSLTVSIGIGRIVSYIHDLYASYDQALHALSYHFIPEATR